VRVRRFEKKMAGPPEWGPAFEFAAHVFEAAAKKEKAPLIRASY
jgi:hypothetical protein